MSTLEAVKGFWEGHVNNEYYTDYRFTYGMRHLTGWLPTAAKRLLGRAIGWHLMIDARKAG